MMGHSGKLVGLLAALALGSCATTHASSSKLSSTTTVDPALIAGLNSSELYPVTQQQKALDEATATLDEAKNTKADADRRVRLAESDVDASRANLKRSQQDADIAHKAYEEAKQPVTRKDESPTAQDRARINMDQALEQMGQADTNVRKAQGMVDAENMKLDYLKSLAAYEGANVKLAERQIDLEKANLEKARFQVLKTVHPEQVQAMKLNSAAFDSAVAERQADIAKEKAEIAKTRADATSKYRTWVARGENMIPEGRERAQVPPPPKG